MHGSWCLKCCCSIQCLNNIFATYTRYTFLYMDISYWFNSSHAGCFFRSITFRNICMTQQCGRFWKSAFTFATNIGLDPCLLAFRILLCRYSISLLAYTSVILEGRLLLRSWKMHKFASTASNCLLFSVGIPEIENLVLLYSARVWIRLLYGDVCIRMGFYMSKISTFHI